MKPNDPIPDVFAVSADTYVATLILIFMLLRLPRLGFAFARSSCLLSMLRLATPRSCQQSCSPSPLLPRRTRRKRAQEAAFLEDDDVVAPLHKELFPSIPPAIPIIQVVTNEGDVRLSSGVDSLTSELPAPSEFSAELVVDNVCKVGELSSVSGDVRSSLSNTKRLRSRKGSRVVKKEGKCGSCADEASSSWCSLGVGRAELCLDLTLPTGQSFRWKQTGQSQYTGVVGNHLISLRQIADDDIEFLLHASLEKAEANTACEVEKEIRDYLNLSTSLVGLYAQFAAADTRFAAVAPFIAGARLLRQAPVECVYQFICSSNNHIQRIASMVEFLASQGPYLGCVNGLHFHAFPSLNQLAVLSETQLRSAGFGYRAKYIVGATEMLQQRDEGGEKWLYSLREKSLEDAVISLCSLPGIGPKVAACIALFSLDQHHAIPVDTHVWQIAVRYLLPELEGRKLTPKLHRDVSEAFVQKFGSYAGWAHTVLFIAELSSQQGLLPQHLRVKVVKKSKTKAPS